MWYLFENPFFLLFPYPCTWQHTGPNIHLCFPSHGTRTLGSWDGAKAFNFFFQFGKWQVGNSAGKRLCHSTGDDTDKCACSDSWCGTNSSSRLKWWTSKHVWFRQVLEPWKSGLLFFSSKIPLKYYPIGNFSNINIHHTYTHIHKSINLSI